MTTYDSGPTVSDEATPAFWTLTVDETVTNDDTPYPAFPVDLRAVAS